MLIKQGLLKKMHAVSRRSLYMVLIIVESEEEESQELKGSGRVIVISL